MAQFIEVDMVESPDSDPHEKKVKRLLNKAYISGIIEHDIYGHIWIKYEGKDMTIMGKYELFRDSLLSE